MLFNQSSRTRNAMRQSSVNTACYFVKAIAGFVYRMLFIHYLSVAYLGINGLFTNMLQMLSLADLGIMECISFRFYQPIHDGDVKQVAKLLNYMKTIYRFTAVAVFILGMAMLPFVRFVIRDASEIPADVNINLLYILFVLNSVVSYTFAYGKTLLSADQYDDYRGIYYTIVYVADLCVKLWIVSSTSNYTVAILFSVMLSLLSNYALHRYIKNRYREVFMVRDSLPNDEKQAIFSDAKKALVHKTGNIIQGSTDNMLITYFSGLINCGLFSNYSMIITHVSKILTMLIGSISSSIGNANAALNEQHFYSVFKKIFFINNYFCGLCTVCISILMSKFITLWLGEDYLLDTFTVASICICFYVTCSQISTSSFLSVTGLIAKDPMRSVWNVCINLVASILLGREFGIAGVMLGTIISNVCTNLWRIPQLLFRYSFKSYSSKDFWFAYVINCAVTAISFLLIRPSAFKLFNGQLTVLTWIVQGFLCVLIYSVVFTVFNFRTTASYLNRFLFRKH